MSLVSIVKKALLTGAVIVIVGAGLVSGACKRGYDVTPPEPTTASPPNTPVPTIDYTVTPTATPLPTPTATATPPPTSTPMPNNAFDYAKSLGLEADYLRDVAFDDNSKGLISYLSSMPLQMRTIAERSGLLEDILSDKQIDAKESLSFNKVLDSYKKEIEIMKPWLSLPEKDITEADITAALAMNLSNFLRASQKDENGTIKMFYTLDSDAMPLLLPQALFTADGVQRMYAVEIFDPEGFRSNPKKVYTSTMIDNTTNFSKIGAKAWEVANSPDAKYSGHSIEDKLSPKYFELEAVGSTDKGQNAYEDISLLLKSGSNEAKAALRIYARNLTREGRQGSAPQVRCELTEIDLWSIGMSSYTVILAGHDVPTIPLTLDDIALLKNRSSDPLLILEIDGSYQLPLQWTRKSIVKKEWEEFYLVRGTEAPPLRLKVSDLKNY